MSSSGRLKLCYKTSRPVSSKVDRQHISRGGTNYLRESLVLVSRFDMEASFGKKYLLPVIRHAAR